MSSTINASTASGGGVITSADASGILQLQTAGTPAVTIVASGNVGIGTISPGYLLDVSKNGGGGDSAQLARFTDTNTANSIGPLHLTIGAANHYASNPSPVLCGTNGIALGVGDGSDLANQRKLTIDASGNVGIGTSSPSTKLTVAGSLTITGAFALRGSYGAGAITTNFAAGDGALGANTTGGNNTASGVSALQSNTTGSANTASGMNALYYNTTGSANTASGMNALYYNTTGSNNTAIGQAALQSNTTGNYNTASGQVALGSNTTGNYNTASGQGALYYNTTGANNTASGVNALLYNTTGSGNSAFNPYNAAGSYVPVFNPTTENNRFCMGSTGVTNAYIQVAWTVVSDARDKTNFAPVPHGLDFVTKLQPTAYQFKENRDSDVATGIVRYGFKAQDILALEGDTPVIIDTEDLDKLRFNSDSLIPVLVNAIKELTARLQILEAK